MTSIGFSKLTSLISSCSMQDHVSLTDEQEEQILCSYGVMHQMLSKCAAERESQILPQLGLDGMHVPKASCFGLTQAVMRN